MSVRILPTAIVSTGVTFVLFWVMTALIAVPDLVDIDHSVVPTIDIVKVRTEREPLPEPEILPERQKIEREPVEELVRIDPGRSLIPIGPTGQGPDPFTHEGPLIVTADGDAVPLVRVPPHYPERALTRGVEGRVLIQFTIDRVGNVKEAFVVAAEPPSIFDRAALDAVELWKYNPKVVDGQAVERPGMKIAIPFRLGEGADS